MSDTRYSGCCFCRRVRYELTGKPVFACHCHCESCRHAAGAAFVTWVSFDREALVLTSGTPGDERYSVIVPDVSTSASRSNDTQVTNAAPAA